MAKNGRAGKGQRRRIRHREAGAVDMKYLAWEASPVVN